MPHFNLFAYGTLRSEYGSIGEGVCEDTIEGALLTLGDFPGLILPENFPLGGALEETKVTG
jgi:hypothetical protein